MPALMGSDLDSLQRAENQDLTPLARLLRPAPRSHTLPPSCATHTAFWPSLDSSASPSRSPSRRRGYWPSPVVQPPDPSMTFDSATSDPPPPADASTISRSIRRIRPSCM